MSAPPPDRPPYPVYPAPGPWEPPPPFGHPPPPAKKSSIGPIIVTLIVVVVLGGLALAGFAVFKAVRDSRVEASGPTTTSASPDPVERFAVGSCLIMSGSPLSPTTIPRDCDDESFVTSIVAATMSDGPACEAAGYPSYLSSSAAGAGAICLVPNLRAGICYQKTSGSLGMTIVDCDKATTFLATPFKVLDRVESKDVPNCRQTVWAYSIATSPPREVGYCVEPITRSGLPG
ncbi:MAG: hypothetical protein U0R77_15435 [Mycolicibacterium insubricum]|nr:hypothetical protein [Mycobacterium sp.]